MNRWMAPTAIALSLLSGPALLVGFGSAATAQTPAASGNNSSAPVDISADEQEVINSQCKTIFRGAVEVLQDKARMRAATMTVYNRRKTPGKTSSPTGNNDCGDVDRVEADGNVFYVTPEQTVRGDHAVYTYDNDTIVVTGDVVAVQGQDVARGDRMTIKTKTNDVKMESNATGRGKTRVRAVLYPDQNKDKKPAGKP
ncbi:LptA/OstA family protein [Caulobacter sp. BK020]|jgi:lipopolysaccharide export system protein LptA|uniref:LptA/OstA family protein n=1 Tax=Caulobacter sp. BK020 TaxID=2512117 RepID=UPI0010462117|nr:LptA/OstA family protein [Caulobacter sp. BK020]TCS10459.1 lipopolysaccharide export system protein LptA [Caulobacter sp. BK020]